MKRLIVDDEPLARSALIQLCERSGDVQVIGEAESGCAAIAAAERRAFAESMKRARQRVDQTCVRHSTLPTLQDSEPALELQGIAGAAFKLLMGEREHRLYPLNTDTIHYIESEGNYVTIRSGVTKYISRDSIKRLAVELAGRGFIRIERSLLINVRAVSYVESVGRGTFAFTLSCGACLHSSSSYRDAILRVLPIRRLPTRRQPA
ncbi:MAG: response regulator transcription factor [Gammaproteobacteria bacterium]